jgi:tRNA-splicing ligase RtcB
MMLIHGKFNTAIVYNDNVDEESFRQVQEICDQELFAGIKIRIMPDVHAGKGCVIGYTANLGSRVVPNLIGLDIGCGILSVNIGRITISYDKLDKFIRRSIPFGFERNKRADPEAFPEAFLTDLEQACDRLEISFNEHVKGLGSLGGGNHFIEVASDNRKNKWLLIHSGSRNFGLQVATWHQGRAMRSCREKGIEIPRDFAFLEGDAREDYFTEMKIAQQYASLNRQEMVKRLLMVLGMEQPVEQFETIHNYINFTDNIIRKGAISAHAGEKLLIPLNMRDGSLIALGKGNGEWNFSAPHGAGRRLSRNQAKKQINIDDFRKSMEHVWTSTVSERTKDEAPMAYKPGYEILSFISETTDIKDTLVPVYNFKAE